MKHTVLYDRHLLAGGNMAPFGGYKMPLWYQTGVKAEHMAVITGCGMFDTSHMAAVAVSGGGSRDLLQHCFSKDLDRAIGAKPLRVGRCVYGVFLQASGHVLDDAIVYMMADDSYLVVVNAGMGAEVAEHLRAQRTAAKITDLTDRLGKMDIQGPKAGKVLQKILQDPDGLLGDMAYFSFKGGVGELGRPGGVTTNSGIELLLSRTGYTGEFGFELFCEPADLVRLWDEIAAAGADFGLIPCGLAARDSLRAGALLPLSHQDIGDWLFLDNPWQFGLPLNDEKTGFTKDFIGAGALVAPHDRAYTLPFAGYDPRKIPVSDKSYVEDEAGNRIGRILTCTTDMAIDRVDGALVGVATSPELKPRGLSCGFVLVTVDLQHGDKVVLTDSKRKIPVEIRSDVRPGRTARAKIAAML